MVNLPEFPLVTIMIPTHGQASYLSQAIESALAQSYSNLEVVVINDASPDQTDSIVNRYLSDGRLRYVHHNHNLGRIATYQRGLSKYVRGNLVLNLDGDDWLLDPSYISLAVDLYQRNPDIVLTFARMGTFDEATSCIVESELNRGLPEICDGTQLFLRYASGDVGVPHVTALYRRDLALELEFYKQDVIGTDTLSFLILLPGRKVGFVDKMVAVWRNHGANTSLTRSVADTMANFATVDIPIRIAESRGFVEGRVARRWRYEMNARISQRQLSQRLVRHHFRDCLELLTRLLVSRPRSTSLAVLGVIRAVIRSTTGQLGRHS